MGPSRLLAVAVAASLAASPLAGRAAGADGAAWASPGAALDAARGPVRVPAVPPGDWIAGAVFIGYRGEDGETTGAVVTVRPGWVTFARVGAELTPRSSLGGARLLWGLGLDDPRDRTFFLHVEDWGPVRTGHGLTLKTAEASVGYKLPRARGGPFELAVAPVAALPFEGGPYAGLRTTLAIARAWFVSAALGWTFPGVLPGTAEAERWRVSFALGRWDGRPGGLFVTYRDDLRNGAVGSLRPADRQGHGVLAVGVNWSY